MSAWCSARQIYSNLFNHFSILGHGICFHFLLIINNRAINSTCIFSSFELEAIPRSEIIRSKDLSVLMVLSEGCQIGYDLPSFRKGSLYLVCPNYRLSDVFREGTMRGQQPPVGPLPPARTGPEGRKGVWTPWEMKQSFGTSCWSSCR